MFLLVWVLQKNWRSHFYSHDLVQKGLIISGRIFQYFHWNKWDGDILLTHHRFVQGSSLQSERWQRDRWNRLLQVLQPDCIICSLSCSSRCCFLFQAKVYRYFISLTRVRKRIWGRIICGNVYLCCSWPHAFIVAERKKEYFDSHWFLLRKTYSRLCNGLESLVLARLSKGKMWLSKYYSPFSFAPMWYWQSCFAGSVLSLSTEIHS